MNSKSNRVYAHLLVVLVLLCLLSGYTLAVWCGNLNCGRRDKCCTRNLVGGYNRCYNPNTRSCMTDLYTRNRNCLCARGNQCCKGKCFDPDQYYCAGGVVRVRGVRCGNVRCGVTQQCCKKVTYDPGQCYTSGRQSCVKDKYWTKYNCVCPAGRQCCAGRCFNPSTHQCSGGSVKSKGLRCGNTSCASGQKCCNNHVWPSSVCYQSWRYCVKDVFWGTNCICDKGQSCCAARCFNTSTHRCVSGTIVKKYAGFDEEQ